MLARKLELLTSEITTCNCIWKEWIISRNQKAKQNTTIFKHACMSLAKHTDFASSYINGRILIWIWLYLELQLCGLSSLIYYHHIIMYHECDEMITDFN